jgi:ribosomal-protein-alanine N-acetyltransferase
VKASEILVREAQWEDAPFVVGLIRQLGGEADIPTGPSESYVRRALRTSGYGLLVAEHGSRIIGVLSYSIRPSLWHGEDSCLIEELVVDTAHRGQGVGTALVQAILGRMEAAGWAEISVSALPDNERAIAFYRSLGLTDEGVLLERHRQS